MRVVDSIEPLPFNHFNLYIKKQIHKIGSVSTHQGANHDTQIHNEHYPQCS